MGETYRDLSKKQRLEIKPLKEPTTIHGEKEQGY
jgi:hypothetical protein